MLDIRHQRYRRLKVSDPAGSAMRPSAMRPSARRAVWLLLGLLAVQLSGCGKSTTSPQRTPPVSKLLEVSDGRVRWQVDQRTRGSVRYGFVSGRYDRIAYPEAAAGADKAYLQEHSVPLLSALPSVPIYFQRVDKTDDGAFFFAAEETVVLAESPGGALLRMTSIDVQFGDAHVLQLPSAGGTVVIDAGNPRLSLHDETAPEHLKRWLVDHGIGRLDYALASHVHEDHIGGFVEARRYSDQGGLLTEFPVGYFLDVNALSRSRALYRELRDILEDRGIVRLVLTPGMTTETAPVALGWDPLVQVTVLSAGSQPEWADLSYDGDAINNDSIVLKISYADVDILTGGDCEVVAEAWILSHHRERLAGIEYFKAHHHGRYDANSGAFVEAVQPRVSLIPIAFAAYNEGAEAGAEATIQTMVRLHRFGADLFRFDASEPLEVQPGAANFWHTTFTTDGKSYEMGIEPSLWGL